MNFFLVVGILCCFGFHSANAITKACPFKPADIIFVVDGSGSEGPSNFQKQLAFIKNFTSQFDIGPNATQVSLVTFATQVQNSFYLNTYKTSSQVSHAIQNAHYPNGETYTHLALAQVREHNLDKSHGARSGVAKIVIVLTDGRSNEGQLTISQASLLKRVPDVTVVAIGIGGQVDPTELAHIASDRNHTFRVTSFDALQTIQTDLTDTACKACAGGSAELFFVLDSSGSEGHLNFDKQLQFAALVAGEFEIGPQDTRVAVITFSTNAYTDISLNAYIDKNALLQNIMRVRYRDGESNTHLGLGRVENELRHSQHQAHSHGHPAHGHHHTTPAPIPDRTGAKKYCIVLTDGRSLEPTLTYKEADRLHKMGVEIFTVGIGSGIDTHELNAIASDSKHVLTVKSFDMLDSIHQILVDEICGKKTLPPTTTQKTLPPTTTPVPTTPTTTPTTPTTTTKPECGTKPADILFVLDSSDSESKENFQKMLDFARAFATQFTISKYNVQFSVLTFSSNVSNQFFFNTYHSRHDILDAIQKTPYLGTGTETHLALNYAREESFTPAHGARANSTKVAIVITDGNSNNQNSTKHEAQLLHRVAQVYSIGIGPAVDHTELLNIASSSRNVVQVNSFDLLHTIRKQLTDTACARHK